MLFEINARIRSYSIPFMLFIIKKCIPLQYPTVRNSKAFLNADINQKLSTLRSMTTHEYFRSSGQQRIRHEYAPLFVPRYFERRPYRRDCLIPFWIFFLTNAPLAYVLNSTGIFNPFHRNIMSGSKCLISSLTFSMTNGSYTRSNSSLSDAKRWKAPS